MCRRMFRNEHLESDEWTLAINWGDNNVVLGEFHLDDPSLLLLQEDADFIKGLSPSLSLGFKPELVSVSNFKSGVSNFTYSFSKMEN